jgi:hypothetical protein
MSGEQESSNLVVRLRDNAKWKVLEPGDYTEAANEIERLRAALVKIKKHWEGIEAAPVGANYQEISRKWRAMYKDLEDISGEALGPADETSIAQAPTPSTVREGNPAFLGPCVDKYGHRKDEPLHNPVKDGVGLYCIRCGERLAAKTDGGI